VENHAHFRKSFLRGTANGRADFGGAKVDVTIIAGLSDLGLVEAAVTPDRRSIRPIVPGLLAWMDKLSAPNFTHAFNFNMVWLGGGEPPYELLRQDLRRNCLFALVDPDGYDRAIEQAIRLLNADRTTRVFNHPACLREVRRDRLMARLRDIPHVAAPKTIRLAPQTKQDVLDAMEGADMTWPVIFRPAGKHSGVGMVLLQSRDEFMSLERFGFDGELFYLIEFVDFRDDQNLYRKYRFVYIGGDIFLRHVIAGTEWNLHSHSRLMNEETIAYERTRLTHYSKAFPPHTAEALEAIGGVLNLDFCGLDCAVLDDGTIVPFEANPAMDIFRNTHPQYDLWDDMLAQSWKALFNLLKEPERWKSAAVAT
jgi:hypothetical protein